MFIRRMVCLLFTVTMVIVSGCSMEKQRLHGNYDVVVYGGTSAGVVAAVQASRMGKSVVLIEPGSHLGGGQYGCRARQLPDG